MPFIADHGMDPASSMTKSWSTALPDGEPQGDLLVGPDRELCWLERQRF